MKNASAYIRGHRETMAHPLSRRIPALLMRIVTPPKASSAVLMTATPSVTDELLTTALPPASGDEVSVRAWSLGTCGHTSRNLIHDLLSGILVEVIYHDIRTSRRVKQRVPASPVPSDNTCNSRYRVTHAFPRPPPAPVITTVWPLKDN